MQLWHCLFEATPETAAKDTGQGPKSQALLRLGELPSEKPTHKQPISTVSTGKKSRPPRSRGFPRCVRWKAVNICMDVTPAGNLLKDNTTGLAGPLSPSSWGFADKRTTLWTGTDEVPQWLL